MNINDIKEIIDFIAKSGLEEVNIEMEQVKIHIKKNLPSTQQLIVQQPPVTTTSSSILTTPTSAETTSTLASQNNGLKQHIAYIEIKSPMVGTFYNASTPDTPPFIKKGDKVNKGQKVCIIEAMKLFNEIESEIEGTIIEILVENASPVEYNQPLFLVNPIFNDYSKILSGSAVLS